MRSSDCIICRGGGSIRLPTYSEVTLRPFPGPVLGLESPITSYKTYSCPECHGGETAKDESVFVIEAHTSMDPMMRERAPGYEEHVRRDLVRAISDEIEKGNFISFATEEPRRRYDRTNIVARLGVTSQTRTLTIEQRAACQMETFLKDVGEVARNKISIWDSHYTGNDGMISKSRAMDSVTEAFRERWEQLNKELNP